MRYFICQNSPQEGNEIGAPHKTRSGTCMAVRVKGLLLTILARDQEFLPVLHVMKRDRGTASRYRN